ncbi:hypothetical protein LSCM1_02184 [Leishmania martiniquensis]|uniref:Uncharacterized protein n=1 Tax=Leishmania martiniquensis TaxID=1580590 RepID=A0A836H1E7_9TRYP|nr:hypothetical protein LSCM1_02184 [Leishmania martiniquensis]
MLPWIRSALFGDGSPHHEENTTHVAIADLRAITAEIDTLQRSVEATAQALASTNENAKLFLQSIEALLLETFDSASDAAETSPETTQVLEIRASLQEERATLIKTLLQERELIEMRLFRAQLQLRALERQREIVAAAVEGLDNPSSRAASVVFPAAEAPQFLPTALERKKLLALANTGNSGTP